MIRLERVTKKYEGKAVLDDLTFMLPEGKAVCILGPSGCGKTTLLEIISGITVPDAGTVNGGRSGGTHVFQDDRLLPWCTALENITLTGAGKSRAETYLEKLGLDKEDMKKLPDELSGGMKRRVAIARALAYGGDYYYLDEPMQGLDIKTAQSVLQVIREELLGKTAVIVTHSPEEAGLLADEAVVVNGPPIREVQRFSPVDASALRELILDTDEDRTA